MPNNQLWVNPNERRNPDVVLSAIFRAASGGGGGEPSAGTYTLSDGIYTLTPPDGVSFGTKPSAAQPFLFWRAMDGDGVTPDLSIGRSSWVAASGFNGFPSTKVLGPGSTRSVQHNLFENSGAMLSTVEFPDFPEAFIVMRRRYDAFTVVEGTNIRTRYDSLAGELPAVGDTVTGVTSGAVGVIYAVTPPDANGRGDFSFKHNAGTIGNTESDTTTAFAYDETMSWATGSARNAEGTALYPTGTYFTLNNKIIRIWTNAGRDPGYHNHYFADHYSGGDNMARTQESGESSKYALRPHTDVEYKWAYETVVFRQSSGVGVKDGEFYMLRNNTPLFKEYPLATITSDHPDKHRGIFQGQVSNGAYGPDADMGFDGTIRFTDYLYVDDSAYWVQLVNAQGHAVPLPPTAWTEGQPIQVVDQPFLPDWTHMEVFVDGVLTHTYPRV